MSGHSKWSKVKHQKATTDKVKGQAFTKASRAITIAVREGGSSDPAHNFKLRLAIDKARIVNMPKENINRAIEKGSGTDAGQIQQVLYEGYGPGGIAFLIEAATDNNNRTVSLVKNILESQGGSLTSPGAVGYLFDRCGILTVPKGSHQYNELLEKAINGGADDVIEMDDMFELYTPSTDLFMVKEYLEKHMIPVDNAELIMKPKTPITPDEKLVASISALVLKLEDLEDVLKVYTNIQ